MRLTELDPRWLFSADGVTKIGFCFIVPTKPAGQQRQTCFFTPTPFREQCRAMWAEFPKPADPDAREYGSLDWQPCNQQARWTMCLADGAEPDFGSLSVVPSLDGSSAGNWHGFITNGEIVGGL